MSWLFSELGLLDKLLGSLKLLVFSGESEGVTDGSVVKIGSWEGGSEEVERVL